MRFRAAIPVLRAHFIIQSQAKCEFLLISALTRIDDTRRGRFVQTMKKILVALSGGVDSAVAALLL